MVKQNVSRGDPERNHSARYASEILIRIIRKRNLVKFVCWFLLLKGEKYTVETALKSTYTCNLATHKSDEA